MNRLMSVWRCWANVIPLVVLFNGCYPSIPATAVGTPSPFSCDKITESHWQEFRFGVDSPDNVVETATRLWKVGSDGFSFNESSRDDFLWVLWEDSKGERVYSARFRGGKFHQVAVGFQPGHRPTLAQAIDCLGAPDYFAAYGGPEGIGLALTLLYPKKGFEISHISRQPPARSNSDLPVRLMDDLFVVAPGPPELMVRDIYSYGHLPSVHSWGLCVLRPWPGSIEAIEVESFLGEDARCKST